MMHLHSQWSTEKNSTELLPILNSPGLSVRLQQPSGDMPLMKIIGFLAVVADFVLGGLLSNGFIIAVVIMEWTKSRSLAAFEQLLLSLGISNICFSLLINLGLFFSKTTSNFHRSLIFLQFKGFSIYFGIIRYWLTAWLCVFYCVKILNSTHSFFLWWKMRIARLVPRLIVGSCIISLFASFFLVLSVSRVIQSDGTVNITNITQKSSTKELWKTSQIFFLVLGSGCPLFIVFFCCVLVVASLCRHICQITNKGSNFRSLQIEAHIKAARTVLSLLFLYISFYVAHTVEIILEFQIKLIPYLVCSVVMMIYSPVQGAILVLSNPKLKQTILRMLARAKT